MVGVVSFCFLLFDWEGRGDETYVDVSKGKKREVDEDEPKPSSCLSHLKRRDCCHKHQQKPCVKRSFEHIANRDFVKKKLTLYGPRPYFAFCYDCLSHR